MTLLEQLETLQHGGHCARKVWRAEGIQTCDCGVTAAIESAQKQAAEIERLKGKTRCCKGCPDCVGIGVREEIKAQAAEIERLGNLLVAHYHRGLYRLKEKRDKAHDKQAAEIKSQAAEIDRLKAENDESLKAQGEAHWLTVGKLEDARAEISRLSLDARRFRVLAENPRNFDYLPACVGDELVDRWNVWAQQGSTEFTFMSIEAVADWLLEQEQGGTDAG